MTTGTANGTATPEIARPLDADEVPLRGGYRGPDDHLPLRLALHSLGRHAADRTALGDELMRAMSDDLMQDGDVNRALQRVPLGPTTRRRGRAGLQGPDAAPRDRRQEQLERYDLQSMLATSRSASNRSSRPSARGSTGRPTRREEQSRRTSSTPEQEAGRSSKQQRGAEQAARVRAVRSGQSGELEPASPDGGDEQDRRRCWKNDGRPQAATRRACRRTRRGHPGADRTTTS